MLHEITVSKYAAQGKIPTIRIGKVWRFNKGVIDRWITGGQRGPNIKHPRKRKDNNLF
ncbi:MAG: helix-turn-helix domain-containing protein [Desulfobacteraceae bacterium]|nr:helix-turn-helix domain-containing protein [Desulfobacteraceae bacterium]